MLKRVMKQQQQTIESLEKQIKAVGYERDKYRREIEKTAEMNKHIEDLEKMSTNQAKKELSEVKKLNIEMKMVRL